MRKTYRYHLFLRNPQTQECKVMTLAIDSDGEFLTIHDLFAKLHSKPEHFDDGFTLVGLNVGQVTPLED